MITVIGAGSWGTALAVQLTRNGNAVNLWGNEPEHLRLLARDRVNQDFLPDIALPDLITIVDDLSDALSGASMVILAVPSHAVRPVLERCKLLLSENVGIICASKGFDPKSGGLLDVVIKEQLGERCNIAILSGPSFAMEVGKDLPTAVSLASTNESFAKDAAALFHSAHFRVYQCTDVTGVQVGGSVKNVLAIATGISDGIGYGANTRCALITRGLAEMTRLGVAMGAEQSTFMGLAGVGDLVLTCTDNQSRNRRFGLAVGEGIVTDTAEKSVGQVVEGKGNAFQVKQLAEKYKVEMPITTMVCEIIEGKCTPQVAVEALLSRDSRSE